MREGRELHYCRLRPGPVLIVQPRARARERARFLYPLPCRLPSTRAVSRCRSVMVAHSNGLHGVLLCIVRKGVPNVPGCPSSGEVLPKGAKHRGLSPQARANYVKQGAVSSP
jgi:hypothetical protein